MSWKSTEAPFGINKNFWAKEIQQGAQGLSTRQGGTPRGRGRTRTLVDRVWAPGLDLLPVLFIFSKSYLRGFSGHSENFCFLHKNNTMAVLLKTTSVRVSFIQIMQVRVQNKGKSVWKSRYVGDVSVLYVCFISSWWLCYYLVMHAPEYFIRCL